METCPTVEKEWGMGHPGACSEVWWHRSGVHGWRINKEGAGQQGCSKHGCHRVSGWPTTQGMHRGHSMCARW